MGTAIETRTLSEALPEAVLTVLDEFLTAELTTLGKGDRPVTWPIMPYFWAERGTFFTFTSIGFPQKALNIRRDPRASLLFSDPTGSGLGDPPIVLVQGTASAPEAIIASAKDAEPLVWEVMGRQARRWIRRQPSTARYLSNRLMRYLMDWYFMRMAIIIKPERIIWWSAGDCSTRPETIEVTHVDPDPTPSA
ncbi:MAG: pyridoxamine 5'-phosphate oxidase family protein [Candidatus Promineifilaceae bacterium]|nr:pyridoxamine 5'-phosphate oxidase family protein [Candidatus Promineifilaceae bacterium]